MFSGKYDKDCTEKLRAVAEIVGDAIGAALLFAGIIGVWFIGCAAL